jgi:hypothetical protein
LFFFICSRKYFLAFFKGECKVWWETLIVRQYLGRKKSWYFEAEGWNLFVLDIDRSINK